MAALDGSSWGDLTAEEKQAAITLGYDSHLWDGGSDTPISTCVWEELALSEQDAALLLGYTHETWNQELDAAFVVPLEDEEPVGVGLDLDADTTAMAAAEAAATAEAAAAAEAAMVAMAAEAAEAREAAARAEAVVTATNVSKRPSAASSSRSGAPPAPPPPKAPTKPGRLFIPSMGNVTAQECYDFFRAWGPLEIETSRGKACMTFEDETTMPEPKKYKGVDGRDSSYVNVVEWEGHQPSAQDGRGRGRPVFKGGAAPKVGRISYAYFGVEDDADATAAAPAAATKARAAKTAPSSSQDEAKPAALIEKWLVAKRDRDYETSDRLCIALRGMGDEAKDAAMPRLSAAQFKNLFAASSTIAAASSSTAAVSSTTPPTASWAERRFGKGGDTPWPSKESRQLVTLRAELIEALRKRGSIPFSELGGAVKPKIVRLFPELAIETALGDGNPRMMLKLRAVRSTPSNMEEYSHQLYELVILSCAKFGFPTAALNNIKSDRSLQLGGKVTTQDLGLKGSLLEYLEESSELAVTPPSTGKGYDGTGGYLHAPREATPEMMAAITAAAAAINARPTTDAAAAKKAEPSVSSPSKTAGPILNKDGTPLKCKFFFGPGPNGGGHCRDGDKCRFSHVVTLTPKAAAPAVAASGSKAAAAPPAPLVARTPPRKTGLDSNKHFEPAAAAPSPASVLSATFAPEPPPPPSINGASMPSWKVTVAQHAAEMAAATTKVLLDWLIVTCGLHESDARTCAESLFKEGCRSVADVAMLAEEDDLPNDLPKVMRKKIGKASMDEQWQQAAAKRTGAARKL